MLERWETFAFFLKRKLTPWFFHFIQLTSHSLLVHIHSWQQKPIKRMHASSLSATCVKNGKLTKWLCSTPSTVLATYDRGEPAVSYKFTGWVWEINWLKFKTAGKLPIILEESIEYTPVLWRKTGGCQHVTGWTCKHLGSQPVIPKNLPDHC